MSRCHSRWADANKCLPNPKNQKVTLGMANTQKKTTSFSRKIPIFNYSLCSIKQWTDVQTALWFSDGLRKTQPVQRLPKPQWKEKEKNTRSQPSWLGFLSRIPKGDICSFIRQWFHVIPIKPKVAFHPLHWINQPTNQLFFYILWLNKKKHTKSFNDASYNPQFHPIQYYSTTYFSNATQKSRSVQKMSTAALKNNSTGTGTISISNDFLETSSDLSEMSTQSTSTKCWFAITSINAGSPH